MDIVDGLRAFVATAQSGSFTEAARQLGISNRLTSKYVAELEDRLGVRLLQRTTRKVGLTPAGQDLLARAPALLDDLDDVLSDISENSRGFTGLVRVSAPVSFGETHVAGLLARFAAQHPELRFDLRLNDDYVDLARDGIDLAFRIGTAPTLSLKSKKLGVLDVVAAASPGYLKAQGVPETPDDLINHRCIVDTNRRDATRWQFEKEGTDCTVQVSGSFMVNSARAAGVLAIADHGVVYGPRFALADAIKNGRLRQVLAEYSVFETPVSAVYLEGRSLPRKIRGLIDFAAQEFKSLSP